MTLFDLPRAALEAAACRKARLPRWRVASVHVLSGWYAVVHFVGAPDVTVHDRDILAFEDIPHATHTPEEAPR